MGTVQNNKRKESKDGEDKIVRRDLYIIFLFAVQVFLYFSKPLASNFALVDIIAGKASFNLFIFILYCFSFFLLFMNLFYLFLSYKVQQEREKDMYLATAFIGTIVFFIVNFILEVLILRINQPIF